jgi:hypothetical protein
MVTPGASVPGATQTPKAPLYTPLNQDEKEIRLLRVAPYGCGDDDVLSVCECTMFKASLTEPLPRYNAFSYEWGYTQDISVGYKADNIVVVNGHRVQVTKNLVALLTRHRNIAQSIPDSDIARTPVWIDALCIDQSNIEERNSQVALMGTIYSRAQSTLSWLGESEDDSDYAMDVIARTGLQILKNMAAKKDEMDWIDVDNQPELWKTEQPRRLNRFWASLGAFMRRTYWTRAWIVQEVMLQSTVVIFCGKLICHYMQLEAIHRWLRNCRGRPCPPGVDAGLWELLSTRVGWYQMGLNNLQRRVPLGSKRQETGEDPERESYTMWKTWIISTVFKQATEPRDKLYSVLGLVGSDLLRPDYSASVERVFADFAERSIRMEGGLDILNHAGHFELPVLVEEDRKRKPPATNLFVPTWAPNWDQISKTYDFTWFFNPNDMADDGWEHIHPVLGEQPWLLDSSNNTLVTPGIIADTISRTRICDIDDGSWLSFCLDYIRSRAGQPYPTVIPPLQALAHLLMRGHDFSGKPLDQPVLDMKTLLRDVLPGLFSTLVTGNSKDLKEELRQAQETFGLSDPADVIENFIGTAAAIHQTQTGEQPSAEKFEATPAARSSTGLNVRDSMNFHHGARGGMSLYVAFVTSRGYLGWGRKGLQKGDQVCVLPTCRMPLILRHVGSSRYINLGASRVQGLMHGEAVSCVRGGMARVETFHIV